MKKFALVVLALTLFVFMALAQNQRKDINVSSFRGVDAGSVFEIELTKSQSYSLSIQTEPELFQFIESEVDNGILSLEIDGKRLPKMYRNNMPKIKVFISSPNIEIVELSGVATLSSNGNFTSDVIKISLSGASKIYSFDCASSESYIELSGASFMQLSVKSDKAVYDVSGASSAKISQHVKKVILEASGASKVSLKGEGSDIYADVSGTSSVDAYDINFRKAEIDISGVSRLVLGVSESLSIEASGTSSVKYRGNPRIITKDVGRTTSIKQIR